jgi:hypothetical protein
MLFRKRTTKPAKQRKIMVQKTTSWKSAILALPGKPTKMRVGKTANLVLPRNPGGNREPNQDEGGENSQPNVAEKPRRKRGRPKKIVVVAPIDTIKEQFTTEKIAAAVDSKRRHKLSA